MKVKVYNQTGKETGTIELPDAVFGVKWNADLVHQVAMAQWSNERKNVAHSKDRAQVRGGGRKPWRQKGTGRARHGSIRSPIWKGGGVTHGPRKEEDFSRKINKKMARAALYTVLSSKVRDNEILIVDNLSFPEAKTKHAAEMFKAFAREFSRIVKGNGVLVALPEKNATAKQVIKNLPYAGIEEARNLNAREVLQYKYVLFPQEALEVFKKTTSGK